ncbi:FliM/FliN family flagellar motor switch protein [Patulibacter minatonensis]|uniref:FliM/FliN family flagellar motor switch protein n=1 Tax=Patulibacter minatonensis TaxID=298163 RepID=UPI000A02AE0C|nr:flagellar motor switch protein FliN [Patulibacter minatonensis]
MSNTEWTASEELVQEADPARTAAAGDLSRLHDVPIELSVEIGRTVMTLGQALRLGPGSIVELRRLAGEPVDLLAGGKPIAHGEVVVVDEEFALRITAMIPAGGIAVPDGGAGDGDAAGVPVADAGAA